jgi:hypothetical protein
MSSSASKAANGVIIIMKANGEIMAQPKMAKIMSGQLMIMSISA